MNGQNKSIKIALIGATGRVGRLLRQAFHHLKPCNITIFFLSRDTATLPRKVSWAWDILDGPQAFLRATKAVGRFDVVFNFSGITQLCHSGSMDQNLTLAVNALNAAAQSGVGHFFTASSAAVYGRPANANPLTETDVCRPLSDYGSAKLVMEHALLTNSARAFTGVTCMRIGNVAGADQLLLRGQACSADLPLVLDRFANNLYPLRSYIGPVTLAKTLIQLAKAAASGAECPPILNVAAPEPVYMDTLLDAVPDVARPVNWRSSAAPDTAIPTVVLDTTRLEQLYRFAPSDSTAKEMISQWLATRGSA